jgi:hypothetical protein
MKRISLILLVMLMLMPMTPGLAQNPVSVIDALDIFREIRGCLPPSPFLYRKSPGSMPLHALIVKTAK